MAPLRLLRVRVSAENELFRCSVFVGRVKHADVGKLFQEVLWTVMLKIGMRRAELCSGLLIFSTNGFHVFCWVCQSATGTSRKS